MKIRVATEEDLEIIAAVERECFPIAEAATQEQIKERLQFYANHFWLLFDEERLVSFVDGMVTDEEDLKDEMYAEASMHNSQGAWQMIFGVNTIPSYRRQGCAAMVLNHVIEEARKQDRKGLVLTCKDYMIHYYAKFGFVNEGISKSGHGDVIWYQMRLRF